ncbi:MAG: hypothetical protein PHX44_10390 [Sulfurimonas sp.]|uniref:hypothetical protein n=1 Tax=Sulfurimonas sp. TaxID=2022749 RepID=UPI00263A1584|nr:hypothetical protein [Sulfurimonas sp.]MDD2653441.1 hypothetical protein [Sulfurimonas sp.]MDD3452648.1 hypothetical protein [Sulfurimonas sp.]
MFYKTAFYLLLSSLFFAGCSSQQPKVESQKAPAHKSDYVSQSGYYFALIEKTKEGWKLIDIEDKPVLQRKFTNQEILRITENYENAYPHFEDELNATKTNHYLCQEENRKKYTPCTTLFSVVPEATNVAELIVHSNQSSPKYKYISKSAINKAIGEVKLFDAIEAKKEHFKFALCQEEFQKASTIEEFNDFVKKYADYAKAGEMFRLALKNLENLKEEQLKNEAASKKQPKGYQHLYNKSEQQLERENHSLAKKEEAAIHQQTQKIETFRKTLKVGMQTNCGTVVELDTSKAKIKFDAQSELLQWIERRKLFPKGEGCRIVNGKYITPPSF